MYSNRIPTIYANRMMAECNPGLSGLFSFDMKRPTVVGFSPTTGQPLIQQLGPGEAPKPIPLVTDTPSGPIVEEMPAELLPQSPEEALAPAPAPRPLTPAVAPQPLIRTAIPPAMVPETEYQPGSRVDWSAAGSNVGGIIDAFTGGEPYELPVTVPVEVGPDPTMKYLLWGGLGLAGLITVILLTRKR